MTPISTMDDFDGALERSAQVPVLIFKHSATCGLSVMAAEEVACLQEDAGQAQVYLVDVRGGRQVSRAIADRFAIRHESPQVLLIKDGVVRWHGSHAAVTAKAIARALAQVRKSEAGEPRE